MTDYDSNDTALAKIEAGGHGYDIVVPSNSYVQIYVHKNLLMKLDPAELSNHGNIAPKWRDVDSGTPAACTPFLGSGAQPASR